MARSTIGGILEHIVRAGVDLTTRALAEAMPGLELTFPQWRVLVVLSDLPSGATVSEVATRVGVTVPATSRQLRRLARRGLVQIAPDERDRRASRARLTPIGGSIVRAILSYRRERIETSAAPIQLSAMTIDELSRLAEALGPRRARS